MKKYLRFAENYIVLLASLTLGLFLLLFADKSGGVSETENRMLQPFPELSVSALLSGQFMEEFEGYLSDAFPARQGMIDFSDALMGLFGQADAQEEAKKDFLEQQGLAGDEAPEEAPVSQAAPTAEAESEETPVGTAQTQASPAAEARSAALWQERLDGSRKMIEEYSAQTLLSLAGVLNEYRAALPEEGNIFFINVPASDVANPVFDQHRYADWGSDIDEALQPLVERNVRIYNATKLFEPYENEGPMFSTGDLHWYVKTAWRTSNAFVEDLGYAPSDFYDYEYYLRYSLANGPYTPEQLQTMTIERENLMVPLILSPVETSIVTRLTEKKPSEAYDFTHTGYTMYLGGAKGPYRLFETGFHTGRNALVISDSYAFSMLYYLFPYYDAVLQTDLRAVNYDSGEVGATIRQYMEQYAIDDLYLVSCHWTSINGPVYTWRLGRFLDAAPGQN